jgi:hypothetical protein
MSFLHRADCENYKGDKQKPYSKDCIVKNNRLLRYDRFRNSFQGRDGKVMFESKQPLEFLDIDFDGKREIIFHRPCGERLFDEYEVYEYFDDAKIFDIDRSQLKKDENDGDYGKRNNAFHFRGDAEFDLTDQTVTNRGSWGACGNSEETFKSDGTRLKLTKRTVTNRDKAWGACCTKTYKTDASGVLRMIDKECSN